MIEPERGILYSSLGDADPEVRVRSWGDAPFTDFEELSGRRQFRASWRKTPGTPVCRTRIQIQISWTPNYLSLYCLSLSSFQACTKGVRNFRLRTRAYNTLSIKCAGAYSAIQYLYLDTFLGVFLAFFLFGLMLGEKMPQFFLKVSHHYFTFLFNLLPEFLSV